MVRQLELVPNVSALFVRAEGGVMASWVEESPRQWFLSEDRGPILACVTPFGGGWEAKVFGEVGWSVGCRIVSELEAAKRYAEWVRAEYLAQKDDAVPIGGG